MSAKPRTRPRDLVLPVPLARWPGAKARGLPRTAPAVRILFGFSAISKTCWRCRQSRANPSPLSAENHVLLRFFLYLGPSWPRSCRFFVMIQRFNSFAGAIGNT